MNSTAVWFMSYNQGIFFTSTTRQYVQNKMKYCVKIVRHHIDVVLTLLSKIPNFLQTMLLNKYLIWSRRAVTLKVYKLRPLNFAPESSKATAISCFGHVTYFSISEM